VAEGVLA